MNNKIVVTLCLLFLVSCSNANTKNQTVSLLDYISQEQLQSYGLTPDKIALVNQAYQVSHGYNRYDGYQKKLMGNFEVLTNPKNPDEIYIVKDGNFLLDIREGKNVRLYKKGTNLPNPQNISVLWEPDTPAVNIASKEQIYYDLNLDGADIVSKKMPYKEPNGKLSYANYIDISDKIPDSSIIDANIANQHCEPLIGSTACCLTDKGNYQPYLFDYYKGWQVLDDHPKVTEYCNGNIKKERKRLIKAIYD